MALEFDGSSQYIRVTQNSGLPIYNDTSYSVCGWVKAPAQDDKRIFAEGSSASNSPLLTIGSGHASQSKLGMLVRNDAGTILLGEGALKESTGDVFDDAWHHFCWVDNNGDADLYIDGGLDATNFNYTRSGTFTLNRTGISAIIRAAVSHWLDGELFDIRCYNRCLSANEIAEIYHHRGADKVWQGLVGRWRLDDLPSGTPTPLLLDAMDSTSGWSTNSGAINLNATTKKEGTGALSLSKTTTAYDDTNMVKSCSFNLTNQTIKIWVHIKDSAVLEKITRIELFLYCPNLNNRLSKYFPTLSVGWNDLSAHIDTFNATGSPNKANVGYIRAGARVVSTATTLATDDVIYDFYRAGDFIPSFVRDLSGNGNHGTPYNSPIYQESPHRLRRGVIIT
jgi:hypothetical protein